MPTAAENASPLLVARGLHKTYRMGSQDLHVLRGVELGVAVGVAVAEAAGMTATRPFFAASSLPAWRR